MEGNDSPGLGDNSEGDAQGVEDFEDVGCLGAIAIGSNGGIPSLSYRLTIMMTSFLRRDRPIMSVLISDDILQAAQISEIELKREIAILLFQQKKLGLSKARELAEMPLIEFQRELAGRGIIVYDDAAGFQAEVENLRVWGDL